MANPINLGLQTQSRISSKKGMANLSRGHVQSGKEVVREGQQKELRKASRRHSALLGKFVSEQGKGASVDFKG